MNNQPKISVVIPIYNVEKYLAECIDSVLAQTLSGIEIILVNDGSTDNGPQIAESYAERHENIRLIHQENAGLSAARNTGLRGASGQYVYFLDSDDYIEPDGLEVIYKEAADQDCDLVLFDGASFYDDGDVRKPNMQYDYQKHYEYPGVYDGEDLFALTLPREDFRTQVCLQLVKRQTLLDLGLTFLEGIIHEDQYYTFALMLQCRRVKIVRKIVYHRRFRDGSIMMQAKTLRNFEGFYRSAKEMFAFYGAHHFRPENDKMIRRHIANVFCLTTVDVYHQLDRAVQKEQKEKIRELIRIARGKAYLGDSRVKSYCWFYRFYPVYKKLKKRCNL